MWVPNADHVVSGPPIRGEVRRAGFRRLSHGLYLPLAGLGREDEMLRELEAWLLVLPPQGAFTHVTAAALRGWWLPRLPQYVPVFAAVPSGDRPRRAGLCCSRLASATEREQVNGLPVDSATEILLRAARDLALLDLIPMVDRALGLRHVGLGELQEVCTTSRPGVRRLRRAVELADARAESPWESLLRVFHVVAGIPVTPQVPLYSADGRFLARADLIIDGTTLVQEYDGAEHLQHERRISDLRRDRRLLEGGFVRRGYTADDLLNHDAQVLQEIDRALGRRFQMNRLLWWRHLVSESAWRPTGLARLQNRWLHRTGTPDWARTA